MWSKSDILLCVLFVCVKTSHGAPKTRKEETTPAKAVDFLKQYGYLEENGPVGDVGDDAGKLAALYSESSVETAIAEFQKFFHLPVTRRLDKQTVKLMNSRRCGVADVIRPAKGRGGRRRPRRYVLGPNSWKKRHLTYSFSRFTHRLPADVVRKEFKQALDTWGRYSGLTFTETPDQNLADINVGFYNSYHGDRYPFDGPGSVLAHAFYPNTWEQLSGDVHFDDDEDWKLRPGPFDDGVDFPSVALHEIGHALGLSHSREKGSVMNAYYTGNDNDLGYDDILALHKLYISRPLDERPPLTRQRHPYTQGWWTTPWHSTRPVRDTSGPPAPTTPGTPTPPPPTTPGRTESLDEGQADGCTGHFDTVAHIRGQLFIVKNMTLWRLSGPGQVIPGYPVKFHRFFHKFPASVERIDAIYQRDTDSSIVTFSGDKYWVFDGNNFIENSPKPITDYGLPENVLSVDAAMVSEKDSKTYIFSGDMYWRYNETSKAVDEGFPRPIAEFRNIPDNLDAALTWLDGVSYFFKGNNYWALDSTMGSAEGGYPKPASGYWLGC